MDTHPLALNLDVDAVRGMLGGWITQPTDAGLLARAMAKTMASTVLDAGHDVIVPQFLGRRQFVVDLETVADASGAEFVEVALLATRQQMRLWFVERSTSAIVTATQRDARLLVDRPGGWEALDEMYDDFVELVRSRPRTRTIPARDGDTDDSYRRLERALAGDHGSVSSMTGRCNLPERSAHEESP